MSLSFTAVVPHSPLLLPSISRENIQQVKATVSAYHKLVRAASMQNIETILVISSHNPIDNSSYVINQCPQLQANFQEFGDLITKLEFKSDTELSYKIREFLETKKQVTLICEENLSYAASIPLYYFTRGLPQVKVIPFSTASFSLTDHYELGRQIKHILNISSKKIAVIAAGDLSHALTENSPAGYSPAGKEFDDFVLRILNNRDHQLALSADDEFLSSAKECLLRPLTVLLGILSDNKYKSEILSYESPFAIGFLTANLKLV
jgi:aromatic ring-opening dioxygenase LigB subunit